MNRRYPTHARLSVARICIWWRNGFVVASMASAFACYGGSAARVHPIQEQQLKSMSLDQLGNVEVTSASKQPEEVWKTRAAVSVITSEDIRRSGATTLPELLRMIPGVQVSRMQSDAWAVGIIPAAGFGADRGVSGDVSRRIEGPQLLPASYAERRSRWGLGADRRVQ